MAQPRDVFSLGELWSWVRHIFRYLRCYLSLFGKTQIYNTIIGGSTEIPKIPSIEKFRGANDKSITQWLSIFEAHCRPLEISEEHNKRKWQDTLLVTTSEDAFATVLAALNENNTISYEAVKRMLTEKYSGEEYKCHLESKLRNLKFRAGTKMPEFLHELRSTIRDYYGLTNVEQID